MRAAISEAILGGDASAIGTKLTARQRIQLLFDPDTFCEDGLLANAERPGFAADGVLTGCGLVEGRPVAVIAHDPTVKAGSWGGLTVEKQIRLLELADRDLLPVFYLVDSAGGRLTEQMRMYQGRRGAGRIFHLQIRLSGRVPQLCVLFGPAAAGGAYMPAFCDWVGMVDGNASMSLASPRVAKIVIGEDVSLEEMGGARMHTAISGCGDELLADDRSAIARLRQLFAYLPDDWQSRPSRRSSALPSASDWSGVIPQNPKMGYDMREVIARVVDRDSFFEVKERWAQEIIVGFARLGGGTVGVVANQPKVNAGAIFVDSSDKAARFITWCDAFNIPLLFLVDVPGFMVGSAVERQGIIRHGAKLIAAMSSAEVPRLCVVVRKAYAAGYYAMSCPGFEPRATIALPTAEIGAMSAEAAVSAVFAKKIEAIGDAAERAVFVADRTSEYSMDLDLVRLASELHVDAVVENRDLRDEIIRRFKASDGWERGPGRRHHPVAPV
jgi:acetyl-CoA carboxylase carboxyltransferase component